MRVGIIGAMEEEVSLLLSAMGEKTEEEWAGMRFCAGKLGGQDAVVVQCGMGKINAAVCAQILIDRFAVTHVINTGVAGSLDNRIDIGDFVIAKDAVQHDMDCSPIGYANGEIQLAGSRRIAFPADDALRAALMRSAALCAPDRKIFEGRICSGDQFIASGEKKAWIVDTFGGMCCEMEGASIAHVCFLNGIPFGIIRAISDKADHSEEKSFELFAAEAAAECAKIVSHLLSETAERKSGI